MIILFPCLITFAHFLTTNNSSGFLEINFSKHLIDLFKSPIISKQLARSNKHNLLLGSLFNALPKE